MKDEEVLKAVKQAYDALSSPIFDNETATREPIGWNDESVVRLASGILMAQASERSMNYLISKVMEK